MRHAARFIGLILLAATAAPAQLPTSGPAMGKSVGWFLQMPVLRPDGTRPTGTGAPTSAPNNAGVPLCTKMTICDPKHGGSAARAALARVQWRQTTGRTFSYPLTIPETPRNNYGGGVPAVGIDSKDNIWVFERNPEGSPQLFKFGPDYKLLLTVGENVIGHQDKAHGMAVDAQDNVWVIDADGSTITQISPDGRLIKKLGTPRKRGDWDEAKGQRLLWQPMDIAFAPNGDIYIGEGHANESPNDVESGDPANDIGAARIIHLSKDGRFINQWFGNSVGQGKFTMAHGVAVDPANGDVWIGDREQYRIVIYTKDGEFKRTIQMRNLICAIDFDAKSNPWIASGQDGQILRIDRDGNVLAAMGNGAGRGPGQAIETTYMAWDSKGNLYTGDTSVPRVTRWAAK